MECAPNPGIGGSRIDVGPPEVRERPSDSEHRDAAPKQRGGRREAGSRDQDGGRRSDRIGGRASGDGHDDRTGLRDSVRSQRIVVGLGAGDFGVGHVLLTRCG